MQLIDNTRGNYRFFTGIAPYSGGVKAMPGYEVVHATLRQPVPYRQGFAQIQAHLESLGRPIAALCAVELRSPKPFSFAGFIEFNNGYRDLLAELDLLVGNHNPIARTNIAPAIAPPPEPSLYGFSYTVPAVDTTTPTFIVAGAGDLNDQANLTPAAIVRPDETAVDAMHEKAEVVLAEMAARLAGLGLGWQYVTTANIYTVQPLHPILAQPIFSTLAGAASTHGVHWHYSYPPIAGLEFEMDVRSVRHEIWL
ncbi:MAG: hypothetical protein R3A44_35425 [Caldilineaceae bacterium]